MSDIELYVLEVLHAGVRMLRWHRRLARDLVVRLLDEDILVDYIWFVVSGSSRAGDYYVGMRAIVYDDNDVTLECVADWEYDRGIVHTPIQQHWQLCDIELRELMRGLCHDK